MPAAAPALTLSVDLGALVANWRDLARRSVPARASAVVKADGYGLGIAPVVAALYRAGCRDFFTATAAEGAAARAFAPEARIFVLNGLYPGIEATIRAAELIPVLGSQDEIALWRDDCAVNGPAPHALHVDTAMNRLGVSPAEAVALAESSSLPPPALLMSHLACADEPGQALNRRQLESFAAAAAAWPEVEASLCNSAGIFLGGSFLHDLTRPGIALYGGEAVGGVANPMRPVATAKARILQIRRARAGETVSYAAAEVLRRDTAIAVCGVGYADGYLRSLSGAGVPLRRTDVPRAEGFIAGCRVPVLGRVTMDLTLFDVTDVPPGAIATGDFIELFGPHMPLDDVARAAGTIGYELLTALGRRYRRSYMESAG